MTPFVSDRLGTHAGKTLTPLASAVDPTATRLGVCDPALYGLGLTTRLGSTWTALAVRTSPCTSAPSIGAYGTLGTISVYRETVGEFICRGRTYGYGSSIWFQTSRGFIWSGGTANPRWNKSC